MGYHSGKDTSRGLRARVSRTLRGKEPEQGQAQGVAEDRAVARNHTHSQDCDLGCTAGDSAPWTGTYTHGARRGESPGGW